MSCATPRRVARGRSKVVSGFQQLLLRGNVVDLAVVIGAACSAVVQALVKDLIASFIGAFRVSDQLRQARASGSQSLPATSPRSTGDQNSRTSAKPSPRSPVGRTGASEASRLKGSAHEGSGGVNVAGRSCVPLALKVRGGSPVARCRLRSLRPR
jgi:hypothetical protein